MEVIQGGFKEGCWLHDRSAYTQEEIDFANEAFREAGKHDPRWLQLVWNINLDSKADLREAD
jgi:hypothetical protein